MVDHHGCPRIDGIARLAHPTKGVGAMDGFPCLTEVADALEAAAHDGRNVEWIGALMDRFANLTAGIERGLDHYG